MSHKVPNMTSQVKSDAKEWHTLSARESANNQRYVGTSAKSGSNIHTYPIQSDEEESADDGPSIHRTHPDYKHSRKLPSVGKVPGNHQRAELGRSTATDRPSPVTSRLAPPPLSIRGGWMGRFETPGSSTRLTYSYAAASQQEAHQPAKRDGGYHDSYPEVQRVGYSSPPSKNPHVESTLNGEHSKVIMPPHLRAPLAKRQPGPVSTSPEAEQGKRREDNHARTGKGTVVSEPSLSMNAGLGGKSVKSEFPYPCTYTECSRGFQSSKQLVHHKKQEHDYCARCKMDFADDVDLIQHRIDSTINQDGKHTACSTCGDDFESTAGRDAHMKIMHRSRQQIKCPGCGTEFDRGASFVAHVWNNQCPDRSGLVSSEAMSKGRAYAALELEKQEQVERVGVNRVQNEDSDDLADSSVSGGVPVSRSLLDRLDDELDPTHDEEPTFENTYEDAEEASICGSATSDQTEKTSVGRTQQQLASYAEAFPYLPGDKNARRDRGATVAKMVQSTRSTRDSVSNVSQSASGSIFGSHRLGATDWDDFLFEKDFTEKYMCPFERCGVFHEDVATLKAHLVSGWHFGTDHRCVKCLKLFQSPVSLIAHMETSTTRCNIRETQQYGNLIYIISGGFLDIDEHGTLLDDNQLKLVAPTRGTLIEQQKERERTRQEREIRLKARN